MKRVIIKVYTESAVKKTLAVKAKKAGRSTSSHGEHLIKKGLKDESA